MTNQNFRLKRHLKVGVCIALPVLVALWAVLSVEAVIAMVVTIPLTVLHIWLTERTFRARLTTGRIAMRILLRNGVVIVVLLTAVQLGLHVFAGVFAGIGLEPLVYLVEGLRRDRA